jgi:dCMP deaminase
MGASSAEHRQSWDEYFLTIAHATASRSVVADRRVGAVLVRDHHIRSTGYNGSPPRYRGDDGDVTVWAEVNAVLFAAPEHREGATLYTTWLPPYEACAILAASGITEVVAAAGRVDGWERARDLLLDCGVRVRMLDREERTIPLPL